MQHIKADFIPNEENPGIFAISITVIHDIVPTVFQLIKIILSELGKVLWPGMLVLMYFSWNRPYISSFVKPQLMCILFVETFNETMKENAFSIRQGGNKIRVSTSPCKNLRFPENLTSYFRFFLEEGYVKGVSLFCME